MPLFCVMNISNEIHFTAYECPQCSNVNRNLFFGVAIKWNQPTSMVSIEIEKLTDKQIMHIKWQLFSTFGKPLPVTSC